MKEKINKYLKKASKKLLKIFADSKDLVMNNKLIFCYLVGSVINGIIVRGFTIGNVFSITPVLADLFITLCFVFIYFLIKNEKIRKIFFIIAVFISILVCIANIAYYKQLDSFISITFISFVFTNTETGDSNVALSFIRWEFFTILWFPIALLIANKIFAKKKKDNKKKNIPRKKIVEVLGVWTVAALLLFVSTLKGIDYSRFNSQWNREYLVMRFGVYLYQINDVIKSIEPQMASLFGSDKAHRDIALYYEDRSDTQDYKNKYTNIFKGKNVIAIHAESIQSLAMNTKFNGISATPNLNKLAKEGIYFSNFYSQVGLGTSSDTELTVSTSMLPVSSGTVFINYYNREYISTYDLLGDMGYYTFSMHANTGEFWNRNIMHKTLGYNKFYEKSSYEIDEQIGFGLSDKSFITQSVDKIEDIAKEHENWYGTLITLSNHTPFAELDMYGEFDVTKRVNGVEYPYMEGTKVGNYFKSVRYADEQIGLLIDLLDKKGLLDNTILVIYGDHDARLPRSEWNRLFNYDHLNDDVLSSDDSKYKEIDSYWYEVNRKVPFIIWSKDKTIQDKYSTNITTVMGMYDVQATLGNMMGFYNKYSLGSDIMQLKDNVVPFSNGSFITNNVYYNESRSEYKLLNDEPLDETYIELNKNKANELLVVSNDIIVYNFFKKELSNELYEVEK